MLYYHYKEKKLMADVFPHHDLYKKRKKAMLLLNNSVFREYNQI